MKKSLQEKLLSSEKNCCLYNSYTNTDKVEMFHGLHDKVVQLMRKH